MKNATTRFLSGLTLQLLITLPMAGFVARWQYGHLHRIDAERPITYGEFMAAGSMIWFCVGLCFALVSVLLAKPLHRWLGIAEDSPSDDDTPAAGEGQLRSRTA